MTIQHRCRSQGIMAYVGQTRSRALISRLARLGIGECTSRGELPPRRWPFFLDNGAYGDWRSGAPYFDVVRWSRDLSYIAQRLRRGPTAHHQGYPRDPADGWGPELRPDFIVLPDLVGQGLTSLAFSLDHLFYLEPWPELGVRYLAVQDGMTPSDVSPYLEYYQGIFVGGTMGWKLDTGAVWATYAHRHGRPCHVGRVGTIRRVQWARRIGADSIDSCLPLWSTAQLDAFVRALNPTQLSLPLSSPASQWS